MPRHNHCGDDLLSLAVFRLWSLPLIFCDLFPNTYRFLALLSLRGAVPCLGLEFSSSAEFSAHSLPRCSLKTFSRASLLSTVASAPPCTFGCCIRDWASSLLCLAVTHRTGALWLPVYQIRFIIESTLNRCDAVGDNLSGLCFGEMASVAVPTFLHTSQKPFLVKHESLS